MSQEKTEPRCQKNLYTFSHLKEEEYKMLDKFSSMREVRKGERLYCQGALNKHIYILKKGAVKITKLTPQGKEIILDIFRGGSPFGEMAVVDRQERDESAEVLEDGIICAMTKENFERMLLMVPGLSIKITKMIGLRRRKIECKLLDFLYSTVEQRLARALLNLIDDFGAPENGGFLIKIKLTHNDYACMIASTRETVTATLNKLKNEGVIDCKDKYISVKSLDKLKDMCG